MEYAQIYDINRKMHARPCVEVIQTFKDLRKRNNGLDIRLEEPLTGENFDCESISKLLTVGGPFNVGGKVKVIAIGEYPIEKLKEFVDSLGNIFSSKDTSPTTWEVLYKREYGHYPDEAPAQK